MFSNVKIKYKVLFVSLFPFIVMLFFLVSYLIDQYNGYKQAAYNRKIVELFGMGGELMQSLFDDMSLEVNYLYDSSLNQSSEIERVRDMIDQKNKEFLDFSSQVNLSQHQAFSQAESALDRLTQVRSQILNRSLTPLETFKVYKEITNQVKYALAEVAHMVQEPTLFQTMALFMIALEDRIDFEEEEHFIINIMKHPDKVNDLKGPLNHVLGEQEANKMMYLFLGSNQEDQFYQKFNSEKLTEESNILRQRLLDNPSESVNLKQWESVQKRRILQNTQLENQLYQAMIKNAESMEAEYYYRFIKILSSIIVTIIITFALIYYTLKSISVQLEREVSLLQEASDKILGSLTEASSGTSETAASVAETTSTVEELKQTAEMASDNAKNVSDVTQKSLISLEEVEKHLSSHMDGMTKIEEGMQTISNTIVQLSDQSLTIGNIIDTVDDLAEQSHLLAINAAIEAAKAKEHGKGFSVVAQEIRNLAEQSKQATVQVRKILNDIKNSTSSAVMATEQGSKAVNFGMQFSGSMNETIQTLSQSIVKAAGATEQISQNSEQQLVGVSQVNLAMVNIKEASGQHVDQIRHIEGALHGLNEVSKNISQLVADLRF